MGMSSGPSVTADAAGWGDTVRSTALWVSRKFKCAKIMLVELDRASIRVALAYWCLMFGVVRRGLIIDMADDFNYFNYVIIFIIYSFPHLIAGPLFPFPTGPPAQPHPRAPAKPFTA
jgi:hypothetical protein